MFIFIFLISFGTIGGCGGGDESNGSIGIEEELAGELNCTDGIDNDGDTEIDCDDIDCILDPACTDDEPPPAPGPHPAPTRPSPPAWWRG